MTCADCASKNDLIGKLASHLAAASEVLGQLAQRDGATAEIVRLRTALEQIATGTPDAAGIALTALRWKEAAP